MGPFQRRTLPIRYGWAIIAEERRELSGAFVWDVYAQHDSGARVPPGIRAMALLEVDAEMARLERVVEGPSDPFCACGRIVSECDGSRRGCVVPGFWP